MADEDKKKSFWEILALGITATAAGCAATECSSNARYLADFAA
ncbi:hypothetical protein [Candidatus Electronema sp. JM]